MPDQVRSELKLQDNDLRLRGQLDLVLLGDELTVVDLKTQTLVDNGLPEWVSFQLAIYAHLLRVNYGALPARAEVFSLNRGRINVPVSESSLQAALEALARARAADPNQAMPSQEVCHFCNRRLECSQHWDVASAWPDTDAVSGVAIRSEHAQNGAVALHLRTHDGDTWVSGVPGRARAVAPGDEVRLVRVRHVHAADEGSRSFRWRANSDLWWGAGHE